jgi:hypothetical protein
MKLSMLIALTFLSLAGFASANAATLVIPGVSGVPDQNHDASLDGGKNLCVTDIPTGRMLAGASPVPYDQCYMSFPLNLPVGTTIDGVEIAYRSDSSSFSKSINSVLMSNRIKPNMGVLPLGFAGDSVVFPTNQQLFMNMGSLSAPVISGDIFWVQVTTKNVTEVDYVAVTYH